MKSKNDSQVHIDEQGRLIIPRELADRYGLSPGSNVQIKQLPHSLVIRRPATMLAKVYIEPTSRCNLSCRTCLRNTLNEPQGDMSPATFQKIMAGLRHVKAKPTIFFGGLGEPLAHPNIIAMLRQARQHASKLELITNGMLLTEEISRELIAAELDGLWVSLDGAHPESYADVRLGAALQQVIKNVARLRDLRPGRKPCIGVVFVAMRKNIAELPEVVKLGRRLGADRFLVTNVMPYTVELKNEILYRISICEYSAEEPSFLAPHITMMPLDLNAATIVPLQRILRSSPEITPTGIGLQRNTCPFIEGGSTAISWDGNVSPCLPLLHKHQSYLGDQLRISRNCIMGNVNDTQLKKIWDLPEYLEFRKRVQAFEFSPCTYCGGCELSEANEEDCFGNPFPTCGGCLWAQGMIRCP